MHTQLIIFLRGLNCKLFTRLKISIMIFYWFSFHTDLYYQASFLCEANTCGSFWQCEIGEDHSCTLHLKVITWNMTSWKENT